MTETGPPIPTLPSAGSPTPSLISDTGFFEDFPIGRRMRNSRSSTVGEFEGSALAKRVMNSAQAHFNDHFLEDDRLGSGRLVFGLLTASMVYGLASQDTAEQAVSELGWDRLRFRAPVHHGDTIEAFTEVVAAEQRDDTLGEVVFRHWGRRQDGVVVFEGDRKTLLRRRVGRPAPSVAPAVRECP